MFPFKPPWLERGFPIETPPNLHSMPLISSNFAPEFWGSRFFFLGGAPWRTPEHDSNKSGPRASEDHLLGRAHHVHGDGNPRTWGWDDVDFDRFWELKSANMFSNDTS